VNSSATNGAPEVSVVVVLAPPVEGLAGRLAEIAEHADDLRCSYEMVLLAPVGAEAVLAAAQEWAAGHGAVVVRGQSSEVAIRTALRAGRGPLRLVLDGGLSVRPAHLVMLLRGLREGADMVVGARFVPGADALEPPPSNWRLWSRLVRLMSRPFAGRNVSDPLCSLKAFNDTAAEELVPLMQFTNWLVDVELIYLARIMELRLHEIPVSWRWNASLRPRRARDVAAAAWNLAKLGWRALAGSYHADEDAEYP